MCEKFIFFFGILNFWLVRFYFKNNIRKKIQNYFDCLSKSYQEGRMMCHKLLFQEPCWTHFLVHSFQKDVIFWRNLINHTLENTFIRPLAIYEKLRIHNSYPSRKNYNKKSRRGKCTEWIIIHWAYDCVLQCT